MADDKLPTTSLTKARTGWAKGSNPAKPLPLFRQEAIDYRVRAGHSTVMQAKSNFGMIAAMSAVVLAVALSLFITFGRLTRTTTGRGVLVPNSDVALVIARRTGIVTRKLHALGDRVKQGESLLILSEDQSDAASHRLLEQVSASIQVQIKELQQEKVIAAQQFKLQMSHLEQNEADLSQSVSVQEQDINVLETSIAQDGAVLRRKTALRALDILTIDVVEQAANLLSNDQDRLLARRVSLISTRQNLESVKSDLVKLPLDYAHSIATLDGQIAAQTSQLDQNEERREISVEAPRDGVIVADPVVLGEAVSPTTALYTIASDAEPLVAQVLVPSAGAGFLQIGKPVALRYDAFPYQQFGIFRGHVAQIFNVALTASQIQELQVPVNTGQPWFSVMVNLDRQSVMAFGHEQPLRPGMLLEADLAQETRYIYEWLLEPLMSVRGYVLEDPMPQVSDHARR